MPFTFSHPAAVVPLRRASRYFSFAGLVVGSVTPDFEYFMRLKSKYSHTFAGAFWFDLPMALLICFLFFNIVKNPLIDNLPRILRARLTGLRQFNWNAHFRKHWFKVLISIIIGVFTHILWDSFTHRTGYFVQHVNMLNRHVYSIPIYRILQHSSTLIGGIVMLWVIIKLPKEPVDGRISLVYWVAVLVTAIIVAIVMFDNLAYNSIWHTVVILLAAGITGITLAPIIAKGGS